MKTKPELPADQAKLSQGSAAHENANLCSVTGFPHKASHLFGSQAPISGMSNNIPCFPYDVHKSCKAFHYQGKKVTPPLHMLPLSGRLRDTSKMTLQYF